MVLIIDVQIINLYTQQALKVRYYQKVKHKNVK